VGLIGTVVIPGQYRIEVAPEDLQVMEQLYGLEWVREDLEAYFADFLRCTRYQLQDGTFRIEICAQAGRRPGTIQVVPRQDANSAPPRIPDPEGLDEPTQMREPEAPEETWDAAALEEGSSDAGNDAGDEPETQLLLPRATLTVVQGVETGRVYEVYPTRVQIGRAVDPPHLQVLDADPQRPLISRIHAELVQEGDGWVLYARGRNGTILPGPVELAEGQSHPLRDGDGIDLAGRCRLEFREGPDSSSPSPGKETEPDLPGETSLLRPRRTEKG